MTEQQLKDFYAFFEEMPRQGPGNDHFTLKAFAFVKSKLANNFRMLDLGCGSGNQSFAVANTSNNQITAIDNHPGFVELVNQRAKRENLEDRLKAEVADIGSLPESFKNTDLIWSEGAIYNLGFENGLRNWKNYLAQPGYMVVSEAVFCKESPANEVVDYWANEYSEISTNDEKKKVISKLGLFLLGHFTLPIEVWYSSYYDPMQKLVNEWQYEQRAPEITAMMQQEINNFKRWEGEWSYEYFIIQNQHT